MKVAAQFKAEMVVTILDKPPNSNWTDDEVCTLTSAGVGIQRSPKMPGRLVMVIGPPRGKTLEKIIGHRNFATREAKYRECWD